MAHYNLHLRRGSQIEDRHGRSGDSYIGANLQTPPTRTPQQTLQNTLRACVSELGNSWSSTSTTDPRSVDDQTNIVRCQGSTPESARAPCYYPLAPNSPCGGEGECGRPSIADPRNLPWSKDVSHIQIKNE